MRSSNAAWVVTTVAATLVAGCTIEVNINTHTDEDGGEPDVTVAADAPPPIDLELRDGPRFTPFTDAPRVVNHPEVVSALTDEYPLLLRDAGIGGTTQVYFHIADDGRVLETRLHRGSGHPALDEAAMRVAEAFRFRPALNRAEPVEVWVVFPITFRALDR